MSSLRSNLRFSCRSSIRYSLLLTSLRSSSLDVTITGKAMDGTKRQISLSDYARRGLLPTPTATNAKQGSQAMDSRGHPLLPMAAMAMFPTPSAGSSHSQGSMREWGGSKNPLRKTSLGSSHLNPRFVAEMMGFPAN